MCPDHAVQSRRGRVDATSCMDGAGKIPRLFSGNGRSLVTDASVRRVSRRLGRVAIAALVVIAALVPLSHVTPAAAQTADPSGEFVGITPARIMDTRIGQGYPFPLGDDQAINLTVTGAGGLPSSGVAAIVANVTVVTPSFGGWLTLYPAGEARPLASNLNWEAGQIVSNLVTVKVGTNGQISLYNFIGSTHVVIDVLGSYSRQNGQAGSRYHAITPSRIMDSRDGTGGPAAPLSGGTTRTLQVGGAGGVPGSGAKAVALNVTVVDPNVAGFVVVWPGNVARPVASNLNFPAGRTLSNMVIVRLPNDGTINLYNLAGDPHVVVDVLGWYDENRSGDTGRFVSVTPARVLDTRPIGQPIGGLSTRTLPLLGQGGLPTLGVGAVVANVTIQPTVPTFLTAYPSDVGRPLASNLNGSAGETVPNLVTVKVSQGGAINLYNHQGATHVIVDVAGYFIERELGFDTCEVPSLQQMSTWRTASPYRVIGIYIGGAMRACANTPLNSTAWVEGARAQGWRFIPTYVGLQAPCTDFRSRIDPGSANAQGGQAAEDAANRALVAGLHQGAPLYLDMEAYNSADSGCVAAVQSFVTGWVNGLHQRGFAAGLYSSLLSGIQDHVKGVQNGQVPVDALWIAAWNDTPNIYGFPQSALPDSMWSQHQRIHQYVGGHNENWGGVTINIDTNVVDGPVAT